MILFAGFCYADYYPYADFPLYVVRGQFQFGKSTMHLLVSGKATLSRAESDAPDNG